MVNTLLFLTLGMQLVAVVIWLRQSERIGRGSAWTMVGVVAVLSMALDTHLMMTHDAADFLAGRGDGEGLVGQMYSMVLVPSLCVLLGSVVLAFVLRSSTQYRQRTEEALIENERMYRGVLEGMPAGVLIHRDMKPLFVNEAYAAIHEMEREEVLGLAELLDLVYKEDRARLKSYASARMAGEPAPARFEYRSLRGDGGVAWLDASVRVIEWNGGRAIQSTVVDITARKRAELEALRHRDELESLLDATPTLVFYKDAENNIIRANRAAAAAMGVKPDDMAGTPTSRWYPDQAEQFHEDELEVLLSRKPKTHIIERLDQSDGECCWVRTDKYPVLDSEGNASGLVVFSSDITAQKRSEDLVRASEERHRTLVECLPVGITVHDHAGRIVASNPAASEVLGLTRDQLEGRSMYVSEWKTVHKDGRPFLPEEYPVMRTLRSGEPESGIVMGVHKPNGDLSWVTISTKAVFENDANEKPTSVIATFVDITRERSAVNQLRESEERHRTLIELSPYCILELNGLGCVTSMNEAGLRMLGIESQREVVGSAGSGLACEADYLTVQRAICEAVSGQTVESEFTTPDGRVFAAVWRPESGRGDAVERVIGIIRDVTERRANKRALDLAHKRLSNHLNNTPLAVIEWDAEGRVVMWSDRAEAIFGRSQSETIGSAWNELNLIHPDDMDEAARLAGRLMSGQDSASVCRLRTIMQDGSMIYCDWYSSALYDEAGRLTSMNSFALDVTDRVKNEQAMRAMIDGVSADTGDAFFRSLARHLADVLDMRWALVGEVDSEKPDVISAIAVWEGEGFIAPFEYELTKTPCRNVVESSYCVHRDGVQDLFPDDAHLAEMGARSYAGIPLRDRNGATIGLIAMLDDQPIPDERLVRSILELFADRASAELARIKAERLLREGESRFRALADNDVVGMGQSDLWGRVTYANQAMAKLFGVDSPDDLLGRDTAEFVDEASRRVLVDENLKRPEGQTSIYELQIVGEEGSVRDVIAFGAPIFGEDGALSSTIGGMVDISDRKNAERALRASEERFRSYFNLGIVGIAVSRVDRQWIELNDEFCRLLGYSREELFKLDWDKITHPDDRVKTHRSVDLMLSGGSEGYIMEKRYVKKDGTEVPVRVSIGCTRREDGEVEHVIALIEDMTERKAAERALGDSQRRYETLAESAPVGIFRADERGDCVYVNERWSRLAGVRPAAAAGDGWLDAIHPDDREPVTIAWKRVLAKHKPYGMECRFRQPDGRTLWLFLQIVPERDEGGRVNGFVATATDITDRRRADQRRKLLMRELDHRVKNNLASIMSLVSMTMRSSQDMDEFRVSLQARIQAMARAHEAMADAGWQSVRLTELTELILKPYFCEPRRIDIDGPDVMLSAKCALPVSLAIHELAVNAMKHGSLSREGEGRVRIAWTAETSLHLSWTETGGPEVLRSRRHGSGIKLIEGLINYQLLGSVKLDFEALGLCCRIDIPNAITEGPDKATAPDKRQRQAVAPSASDL